MAKTEGAIGETQLIAELKNKNYRPVYLLTGEENYTIDVVSNLIEQNIVPEENRDFDQVVLYGRDVSMTQVVSNAQQFPMLSPIRLVLVKEAQDIPTPQWELLAAYLDHPQPSTMLVFCYRHKKLDKRSRAYKAIAKAGAVLDAAKMYENQIPNWIANYVRQHGYAVTERAALLLTESIGNDLQKMANELGKVFVVLPQGATINEDVVEQNIGISKDYNVFELQTALGRRDVLKCNMIVNHFAANPKENPIQMVLPTLYNYFIKLMLYIQLEDKSKAATTLKVHSFFVKDYEMAAHNYTLGKLASCIGYLYEADLRSKGVKNTGTVSDGEILKELVFKIIH